MPRWVEASSHAFIHLGAALIIVAAIAFTGYVFERYDHVGTLYLSRCQPGQGTWFCIAGVFGNAC